MVEQFGEANIGRQFHYLEPMHNKCTVAQQLLSNFGHCDGHKIDKFDMGAHSDRKFVPAASKWALFDVLIGKGGEHSRNGLLLSKGVLPPIFCESIQCQTVICIIFQPTRLRSTILHSIIKFGTWKATLSRHYHCQQLILSYDIIQIHQNVTNLYSLYQSIIIYIFLKFIISNPITVNNSSHIENNIFKKYTIQNFVIFCLSNHDEIIQEVYIIFDIYQFTELLIIRSSKMWKTLISIALLFNSICCFHYGCVHTQFSKNATKHFLHDLSDKRLLAADGEIGKIRIFADYTQVTVGTEAQINTIKRVTNVTANYFYNVLNVTRLDKLIYPADSPLTCNTLTIPDKYAKEGTIGDLGVIVGNQAKNEAVYIAKSLPCAFLQSSKRPIWGILIWNTAYLKFDQVGFQQMVYVAIHQLTHILGFSAMMYELYPKGNPLVSLDTGQYLLNSPRLQQEIKKHFNCSSSKGLSLEDQDGTLIGSHWERKIVGNEFMIASGKKGAYMSRFSLALLESSGWYTAVNYSYAQPTVWGKNKGCNFLNIDICQGSEFCQDTAFNCDWQATAISKCGVDPFSGGCLLQKYFVNTICIDENFQLKNLNSKLNAMERGGSSSRCFSSDFRQEGVNKTKLDQRCYLSSCSASGQYIYINVGSFVLVCRTPGQVLTAPPGLNGTLTCPKNFENLCKNKKTCPYHCNKNGACVNGKCLCTGTTQLANSCVDISIFLSPVGATGGLLNSLTDNSGGLIVIGNGGVAANQTNSILKLKEQKQYSMNSKCIQGTVLDKIFGECLKCKDVFNCQSCNEDGCIICDNGRTPVNKRCN